MQLLKPHPKFVLMASGAEPAADPSVPLIDELVQLTVLLAVLSEYWIDPPDPVIALGSGATVAVKDAEATPAPKTKRAAMAPNSKHENLRISAVKDLIDPPLSGITTPHGLRTRCC